MKKWGILGALDAEIAKIKENMQVERTVDVYGTTVYEGKVYGVPVVLVCCGIGKVNAAALASVIIREFKVDVIVNVGIAGAMGHGVGTLDVVVSECAEFHDTDDVMKKYYPFTQCFNADESMIELCRAALAQVDIAKEAWFGKIATGDRFVNDKETKQAIADKCAPLCVEMEGASIAQVAYMNKTPFLIIRTMSDSADDDADEVYDNFLELAADQSASIILKMLELYVK